jgi:6-phosphogluconolactonase
MRGEEDPEAAALAYEARLVRLGESEPPSAPGAARSGAATVDLVLLGLGDDGHTASLFPGSPALLETRRAVVATEEHAGLRRLTLTLPVLLGARRVLFLVSGAGKREAVRRVLREGDPTAPATMVAQRPRGVTWIMDVAAADGEEVARC